MPQGPFNTLVAKIFGGAGYFSPLALGKQTDLLSSAWHQSKYTQAYQGGAFFGANSAGVTLSNSLATTYVGICLSNPAGSTKNLAVRNISGLIAVAPAGEQALGLIAGYAAAGIVTHTTALTVQNTIIGGSVAGAVAKLDSAATLVGTPVWAQWLAVNDVTANNASFSREFKSGFIIPPGGYLAVGSFGGAGPASGFLGSMEWEEIAV